MRKAMQRLPGLPDLPDPATPAENRSRDQAVQADVASSGGDETSTTSRDLSLGHGPDFRWHEGHEPHHTATLSGGDPVRGGSEEAEQRKIEFGLEKLRDVLWGQREMCMMVAMGEWYKVTLVALMLRRQACLARPLRQPDANPPLLSHAHVW